MTPSFMSGCLLLAILPFASSEDPSAQPSDAKNRTVSIEVKQPLVRYADRVDLSFSIAGRLKSVLFEEGQVVEAGEVLATLENDREKAEYAFRKAKADASETLETAKARIAASKTAKSRATDANQLVLHAIPSQEIRRLELDLDLAVAELNEKNREKELAALEAEIAKASYEATILSSPFTGTITRRLLSKGSSVDGLKPIGQIVSKNKLRVEGFVSLDESRNLRVGDKIMVRQKSGKEVAFDLKFIDVGAQQVQKLIRIWGETTDTQGLVEGEAVTAILFGSN